MRYNFKSDKQERQVSIIFGVLLALAFVFCIWYNATDDARTFNSHEWETECIRVGSGDTYWGIATDYCPMDMDRRYYIQKVKELNDTTSDYLISGEHIMVYVLKEE